MSIGERELHGDEVHESADAMIAALEEVFGDRLQSLVLYGSVTRHENVPGLSDRNLLVILDRVTTEWSLWMDADEELSELLRDRLAGLRASGRLGDHDGWRIRRANRVLGRVMTSRKLGANYVLRLFRTRRVNPPSREDRQDDKERFRKKLAELREEAEEKSRAHRDRSRPGRAPSSAQEDRPAEPDPNGKTGRHLDLRT